MVITLFLHLAVSAASYGDFKGRGKKERRKKKKESIPFYGFFLLLLAAAFCYFIRNKSKFSPLVFAFTNRSFLFFLPDKWNSFCLVDLQRCERSAQLIGLSRCFFFFYIEATILPVGFYECDFLNSSV